MGEILLMSLYEWAKQDTDRLSQLPKVTQLVSGRGKSWTQATSLKSPHFKPLH